MFLFLVLRQFRVSKLLLRKILKICNYCKSSFYIISFLTTFPSRDFDQTEYFENNDAAHNGMDNTGFIFIPSGYA